jgi:sigma-E factor negative regulatory protein RseA
MNEKLSALMDNELDEIETRRLLAALGEDAAARAAWERYHAIRAVLRREPLPAGGRDIARRVRERLAGQPGPGRGRAPLARLAGQIALAASVAGIAILGARLWLGDANEPAPPTAKNDAAHAEYLRASTTRWNTQERDVENTLNAYLVEHNEFAPAAGVSGMLPYVRVVGYDSGDGGGRAVSAMTADDRQR